MVLDHGFDDTMLSRLNVRDVKFVDPISAHAREEAGKRFSFEVFVGGLWLPVVRFLD